MPKVSFILSRQETQSEPVTLSIYDFKEKNM